MQGVTPQALQHAGLLLAHLDDGGPVALVEAVASLALTPDQGDAAFRILARCGTIGPALMPGVTPREEAFYHLISDRLEKAEFFSILDLFTQRALAMFLKGNALWHARQTGGNDGS